MDITEKTDAAIEVHSQIVYALRSRFDQQSGARSKRLRERYRNEQKAAKIVIAQFIGDRFGDPTKNLAYFLTEKRDP